MRAHQLGRQTWHTHCAQCFAKLNNGGVVEPTEAVIHTTSNGSADLTAGVASVASSPLTTVAAANGREGSDAEHSASDTAMTTTTCIAAIEKLGENMERSLASHIDVLKARLSEMEDRLIGNRPMQMATSLPSASPMTTPPFVNRRGSRTSISRHSWRTERSALMIPDHMRRMSGGSRSLGLEFSSEYSGEDSAPLSATQNREFRNTTTPQGHRPKGTFTLFDHWTRPVQDNVDVVMRIADWVSEGNENDSCRSSADTLPPQGYESMRCMLRPSSLARLLWDLGSMVLIFYDTITIPIILAFDVDITKTSLLLLAFWITLTWWTFDILTNFCTGIYAAGVEELRRSKVASRYVRTWLIPDVLIVALDWIGFILAGQLRGAALARVGKTVRILRVMRSLRLLRMLKVRRLMDEIQDHIASEFLQVILRMFKLLFLIAVINHFIACIWYSVGQAQDKSGRLGWVSLVDPTVEEGDITYGYLTALHWSLSQFTTGSMEVQAGTVPERMIAVTTLLFSLMVFSSFLSSITTAMTQLRQITNVFDHNLSVLRRYLKSKDIPHALLMRIMRYVEHQVSSKKQQIQESDVELMYIISLPMRQELMLHIYQPYLIKHPFFKTYGKEDKHAMQRICNAVISVVPLSTGDLLFAQKSSHQQMFFLSIGRLQYEPQRQNFFASEQGRSASSIVPASRRSSFSAISVSALSNVSPISGRLRARIIRTPQDNTTLEVGDWCCEPALWTKWVHVGTMRSQAHSEVLTLDSEHFSDVTHEHPQILSRVIKYGRDFVARLNEMTAAGALSDLAQPREYRLERLTTQAFARRSVLQRFGSSPARASQDYPSGRGRSQSLSFQGGADIVEPDGSQQSSNGNGMTLRVFQI